MPLSTVKLRLVGHKFVDLSGLLHGFYCEFTGQTCCLGHSPLVLGHSPLVNIIVRTSAPSPIIAMEYYPAGQMAAYAVNRRMAGPGPHGHTGHAHTGHGHAGAPLAHHAVGHANGHTHGHSTQGIDDQVISYVTDLQCGDDVGDAARGSPNL